jgi:hypothetical protein
MTTTDMNGFIYDPAKIQMTILEYIDKASNNTLSISDPTNPFTMLLETAAVTSAAAAIEHRSVVRKLYPNLATAPSELLHHLSDIELANMFAVPAEANIVFYVSVADLAAKGYREKNADFLETVIPKYTEVNVLGTIFTLLNDISVRLYNNGSVFVEQIYNNEDIAVNDLGILNSSIITNTNQVPFIIFETKLKQVKRNVFTGSIIAGEGFNKLQTITNDYFYSVVTYKNAATNNISTKLYKSHNEEYINPLVPTVFIAINDKDILYRVPDVYIVDGTVSGTIMIETYETQGKMYLPINKYTPQDFKITLGNSSSTPASSTITNIPVLANSRDVVDGGVNSISLVELRDSIIQNTTGDIDIPVTFNAIKRSMSFNGFEVYKALDIITERLYIAVKNTPEMDSSLILSRQDLFFNTVTLELNNLLNNSKIYNDMANDVLIIKSNTVFREVNNVVTVVSDADLSNIKNMANSEKVLYFKDKNYFFTPYYYIVDQVESAIKTRVYDLDNPVIDNLKISGKNTNITPNCNINSFTVIKTDSCYRIMINLVKNAEFNNLNLNNVKAQLKIPLLGNSTNVFIEGDTYVSDGTGGYSRYVYNINSGATAESLLYIGFDISTDLYINNDNYMLITNGASDIYTKLISLKSDIMFYVYTNDSGVSDASKYLLNELYKPIADSVVISRESATLTLGNRLDYIWNRMYTTYTDRKYKKHAVAQPMVYEEDVYVIDPLTGTGAVVVVDGTISYVIQHHKGDPVLDANNLPVYKYQAGDIVLENNLPVIDKVSGIIRYIDIFMLEYEYYLANSLSYKNYLGLTMDLVNSWLTTDLPAINNKMIENTEVLLRSYKTTKNVGIKLNNVVSTMRYNVAPIVVLYTTKTNYTSTELEAMKNDIGTIIHKYLDNTLISLAEIKLDIINTLGNGVIGVKLTGLDDFGGLESFTINDKTSRLVLDKSLELSLSNELIVRYNIDLTTQTI